MANKNFLLGILVMVLVFEMIVVGCDNGSTDAGIDSALNGTWIGTENGMKVEQKLNNGSFERSMDGALVGMGTYKTSGNNITSQTTHLHGFYFGLESRWYPANELLTILDAPAEVIAATISPQTGTYTISGNTLTMTTQGQTTTLAKKS